MNRFSVSSILLVVVGTVSIIFGIIYVSTPRIMSYHEAFIGLTHEELGGINPRLAEMMLVFLRLIGVSAIGLGILGIAVSLRSYRKGEKWAWYAMSISHLVVLLPTVAVVYNVGAFLAILGTAVLIVFLAAIVLPAKEVLT